MTAAGFVVAAIALAGALLAGVELYTRSIRGDIYGDTSLLVLRVLEQPGQDVIIGDSHLVPIGKSKTWLNLARAGMAPAEEARILAARLKFFGMSRVVIESGPQILNSERQVEFRAFPPETLTRQIFPEPVLILEPSILSFVAGNITDSILSGVSRAIAGERQEKSDPAGGDVAGNVLGRVRLQRPVENFQSSFAWRRHWDIVDRLRAAGVEVCLVQAPLSRIYLETVAGMDSVGYFPALEAIMAEAKQRNVRFVAAEALGPQYPDDMFHDIDHLTREGAKVYWKQVVDLCFDGRERSGDKPGRVKG
jgi:hypothetical protein